jgi:hypothetical protein
MGPTAMLPGYLAQIGNEEWIIATNRAFEDAGNVTLDSKVNEIG